MASLFKQLSDDMEMIARVVEEGTKFMMGESAQMGEQGIEAGSGSPSSAEKSATTIGDDAHFDDEDTVYDGDIDMDALGDAYGSPLLGMADSVMSDIMSTQVGPQTPKEHIQAFAAAITWNEPFIKCLIGFHVVIIVSAIALNRSGGVYSRMGFMIFVGIIIRLAEILNTIGARRWREFSTQNYFDRSGIFMGIMVCAPLLLVCLFMLVSMIREASNLLGDVTRMKMKAQVKQNSSKGERRQKKEGKKGTKND